MTLILLACIGLNASAAPDFSRNGSLYVWDFSASGTVSKSVVHALTEEFESALIDAHIYNVVERRDVNRLLRQSANERAIVELGSIPNDDIKLLRAKHADGVVFGDVADDNNGIVGVTVTYVTFDSVKQWKKATSIRIDQLYLREGRAAAIHILIAAIAQDSDISGMFDRVRIGKEPDQKASLEAFERAVPVSNGEAAAFFRAGDLAFAAGQFKEAATNYQRSLDLVATPPGFLNLGLSLQAIAKWQPAHDAFQRGLDLARARHDGAFEAILLTYLAITDVDLGLGLPEVKPLLDRALSLHEKSGNALGEARALLVLADASRTQTGPAYRLDLLRRAERLYTQSQDQLGQAAVMYEQGFAQVDAGDLDTALKSFEEADAAYYAMGYAWGRTTTQNALAIVYRLRGDMANAIRATQKTLELANDTGNSAAEANATQNLCYLNIQSGHYDAAEPYCKDAVMKMQHLHDGRRIGNAWGTLGLMYR